MKLLNNWMLIMTTMLEFAKFYIQNGWNCKKIFPEIIDIARQKQTYIWQALYVRKSYKNEEMNCMNSLPGFRRF